MQYFDSERARYIAVELQVAVPAMQEATYIGSCNT